MKQYVREFIEAEAVGAARSVALKRAKRKKRTYKFGRFLAEKAERIEASGNPAAAEQFRKFWSNDRWARGLRIAQP